MPTARAVTVPIFKSIAAGLAAVAVIAKSVGGVHVNLVDVGVNYNGPVPVDKTAPGVEVTHARVRL